jgi:YD repeat-containing protein
LSFLFAPSNATKIEIAAIRGAIKGVGKGLVFVAPLSALVDLADVFRKNRIGTAASYQNYGMAGLGAIGGIVGGAAFDAFGFGILASLGLSGIGLFVVAPMVFGLVGGGLFQLAGSSLNELTKPGSFIYNWYPGSFLDRCVSRAWSWFTSGQVNATNAGEQTTSQKRAPVNSSDATISVSLPDASSSRRRPPSRIDPLFPPWRSGPGASAGAEDGGDDGGHGGGGAAGDDPGGGPGGGSVPVGGVLFENCHTVLTGIEELTGAYWDEETQSLVLIGRESAGGGKRNLALPAMDADHLKVALRAAISGESLGVSIDAPADYRYGESGLRMPPAGMPFFVSYLGGCDRTLTGAIFFEADRIMKCLSMGMHNETRKPFQAHVPAFRSRFELHGQDDASAGSSWHRFWFVVDRVELKRSAGTDAVTFGEVRIAVKTELELGRASPGRFNDPLDAQFAQHLTSHYDEYAKEFPVFARLKELAEVSALASFLVDREVDLDLGDMLDNLPIDVSTPQTTPSLLRSEFTRTLDSVHTYAMSGGVDLAITPHYREDVDGVSSRLRESALASRLACALEWSFRAGKASLRANAVRLGSARKLRHVETDHEFPLVGGLPRLRLQRIYESRASGNGMFGPGWSAFVPWSLTVLSRSGKRREVLNPKNEARQGSMPVLALRHRKSGYTQIYRPLSEAQTNGKPVWARMTSRNNAPGAVSFKYDPTDLIYERDGRFVMEQNARKHYFDQSGRLVEISCDAGTVARYVWAGHRLDRLENGAGQGYSFSYSQETGAVRAVQSSDGQAVYYSYGPNTCLREVCVGSQPHSHYGYDSAQRLNEVSNATGTITRRFCYHTRGELVTDGAPDTIDLPDGRKINRMFAGDRLTSLSDENGTRAEFTYGPKGHLHSVFVRNRGGLNWRLEYGAQGKLRRIFGPLGRVTEFECDPQGEVARVMLPDKLALAAKRDDQGRIVEVTTTTGKAWKAFFDAAGLLTSITAPARNRIDLRYAGGILSGLKVIGESRDSTFPIGPRLNPLASHGGLQFHGGNLGEQVGRRFVGRHRIKCTLHPDGRSITTVGPAGTVKMSAAAEDSTELTVEFSALKMPCHSERSEESRSASGGFRKKGPEQDSSLRSE